MYSSSTNSPLLKGNFLLLIQNAHLLLEMRQIMYKLPPPLLKRISLTSISPPSSPPCRNLRPYFGMLCLCYMKLAAYVELLSQSWGNLPNYFRTLSQSCKNCTLFWHPLPQLLEMSTFFDILSPFVEMSQFLFECCPRILKQFPFFYNVVPGVTANPAPYLPPQPLLSRIYIYILYHKKL